ncbi:MAG: hypothetical protein EOO99_03830 [Pedobacter sp.]|nr:MAG: hypothetical protein EOO99_03830 [Pedobacter sp.]
MELAEYIIPPNAYLIICPSGQGALFQRYGAVLEIKGWPSLNNDTDELELRNPQGQTIDRISYSMAFYKDKSKQNGGYSLERKRRYTYCEEVQN